MTATRFFLVVLHDGNGEGRGRTLRSQRGVWEVEGHCHELSKTSFHCISKRVGVPEGGELPVTSLT